MLKLVFAILFLSAASYLMYKSVMPDIPTENIPQQKFTLANYENNNESSYIELIDENGSVFYFHKELFPPQKRESIYQLIEESIGKDFVYRSCPRQSISGMAGGIEICELTAGNEKVLDFEVASAFLQGKKKQLFYVGIGLALLAMYLFYLYFNR